MKITYVLIFICVIIYAAFNMVPAWEADKLYENYGFSGENFFAGKVWTLITSIFIHGGPVHLIFNMIALFFFGRALEEDMPMNKFLVIFLLGGILGNIACLFFYPMNEIVVGASAAIFAIMGVAMIKKPFELIFFPAVVPIPLLLVGILYTLYSIIGFFFGEGDPNVAHVGHLAGLAVGVIWGFFEVGLKKSALIILLIILALIFILPFILPVIAAFDYTAAIGEFF